MALESYRDVLRLSPHDLGIMVNSAGDVCMTFDDPVYVHADAIFADPSDQALHAVMFQDSFLLTHVSRQVFEAFIRADQVLLTGIHPDGSLLQLSAPVIRGHSH